MNQARNQHGAWIPSVPLPLFTFPHRHRCHCRAAFWTMRGYRGHYALAHIILGTPSAGPNDPGPIEIGRIP